MIPRPLFALCALSLLSHCRGEEISVRADFVLPQAFVSSEIKSYEIFIVPASALSDSGATTCAKFFANELGDIDNRGGGYALASFDLAAGATSTRDIKVNPGRGYVALAQGWNVDLVANPDASPRQVIAVGCVPDVVVNGSQTTAFTLALCVCATPPPGSTSAACLNPTCPSL